MFFVGVTRKDTLLVIAPCTAKSATIVASWATLHVSVLVIAVVTKMVAAMKLETTWMAKWSSRKKKLRNWQLIKLQSSKPNILLILCVKDVDGRLLLTGGDNNMKAASSIVFVWQPPSTPMRER